VTATAGHSQTEFLQSYGADKVYDYNQISIYDINDTFDVILDLSNSLTLKDMKKRLTPHGIFIPAKPSQENGGESEDTQVGYLMVMQGDFEKLTRIAQWMSDGKLKPVIDKEFHFSDYLKAISRLQDKGRRGRIILNW
jgi:NADPH:quinone reductase-like Zn-dependent oxidoreductase